MKKRYLLAALALLLIAAASLCGTTLARMFSRTEPLENQFDTAKVGCLVHETLDDGSVHTNGRHETDRKTGIQVENTGNIDAYIRLRFVSYWVDSSGKTVAKPTRMPDIQCTADWIAGADHTYYHKTPVKPGQFTAELLKGDIVLETEDGCYQVVEVFADAIQSKPAKAAAEKWGVVIAGDGSIQTAP